jgi:hypothetical protein
MADYDAQIKKAIRQMRLEEEQARRMGGERSEMSLSGEPSDRQSFNIQPKNTGTVLDRLRLQGGGSKNQDMTAIGGRLGYTQPIDDSSSIEAGLAGHYVKGKDFKDVALDRADLRYQKKFENDSKLRARIGANVNKNMGKRGIDEANIEYEIPFKKGGKVKVSKASKRADGCAQRGKTRGRMV